MRSTPVDTDRGLARLLDAARNARRRARARYSRFRVGAAIEAADGSVVGGCNIENASYGLTICAERVAVFAAVAAGHRRFRRLVIVTAGHAPTPPCGACRQVLWELAPDIEIVLAGPRGKSHSVPLRALLPLPFDHRRLTLLRSRRFHARAPEGKPLHRPASVPSHRRSSVKMDRSHADARHRNVVRRNGGGARRGDR